MTPDDFFEGYEKSREIFKSLQNAIKSLGQAGIKVSKSQAAFVRKKIFARVWIPQQYLQRKAAPLVLTLGFRHRDPSPRWKEIVEPGPGRFTHHLELHAAQDIDAQVKAWLQIAWDAAG